VPPETVSQLVSCGTSLEHHLESIGHYVKVGYDHIKSVRNLIFVQTCDEHKYRTVTPEAFSVWQAHRTSADDDA
jgi:hypothetical protein